jgi:transmembrane sensor
MTNRITDEAVAWFVRLRSAAVTSGDRHAHQQWLMADDLHRQAFAAVASEWSDLDQLDGWARAELAQLNLAAGAVRRRRNSLWISGLATAATLTLSVLMWPLLQDSPERYQTDQTERREITLADGSRLHLNATSAVEVRFDEEIRQLTLQEGEGVFDVEHDSNRPFVVLAGNSKIIALGTRFSVYHVNHQDIQVTVLDGRVVVVPLEEPVARAVSQFSSEVSSLQRSAQITQLDSLILEADQQARVSVDGKFLALLEVSAASEAAWIEGKLVFDSTPLREVVDELSRYIPGQIRVAPSVPDYPVTGIIQIRSSETMLELLAQVVPVTAVKQSASLTVLHANSALPNRG